MDGTVKASLRLDVTENWDTSYTVGSHTVRVLYEYGPPGTFRVYFDNNAISNIYRGMTSAQLRLDVDGNTDTTYYIYADKITGRST